MHTLPQDPSFVKHYQPCLHGFNTIHDNTLSLWLLEGHVVCIEQSVFCVMCESEFRSSFVWLPVAFTQSINN